MKAIRASVLALSISFGAPSLQAGGIPVIDVASLTQAILTVYGQAKEISQLIEQVKTAKNQLQNAKDTLKSMTGDRAMSYLMDMTGIRQVIPEGYLEAAKVIQKLGAAGASKDARNIYDAVKYYACETRFSGLDQTSREMKKLCDVNSFSAPNTLAMVEQSVKRAEARAKALGEMIRSIDTSDSKAALDLQNRIQLESALLQNEKMMMDMALQSQNAQKELVVLQLKERSAKMLHGSASPAWFN